MIPKIIHYCWLSSDPYPDDLQNWMQTWKEKLPDYEFRLWNFNNFDKKLSLWVRQAFENKKYAFAADYIRLFAVYNYGGIYLDMDIEVIKSFDDLLDSDLVLAYENDEKTGIEAGCFGAEKGNPVIKECLDYYAGRSFIKDDGTFDILPLPRIMNRIISKYENISIKSCDHFTAKSFETGNIKLSENTYTIHHFAGSWLDQYSMSIINFKNKILKLIGKNIFSKLLIVLFCIVQKYRYYGFCRASTFYLRKYVLRK